MDIMDDKENLAPVTSSETHGQRNSSASPKKNGRKGRSKSIGPGSLDEPEAPKQSAKDRRKSAFVPATKSILSKNEESERAARRKSMMNRRVSFAPEATLHTWDIIVDAKDHTTSTDSADSTRRGSAFSRASNSPGPGSEDEDAELLSPSSPQVDPSVGRRRRASGGPSGGSNDTDDGSSSGMSESEDEGDSGDDTGTAMSLDIDETTVQSAAGSDNSTGSSERLERSLRQAAVAAGTRGIEYDEFGDMSMEIAEEEITNAFKPRATRQPDDALESAHLDQENINPFSPAFKAEVVTKHTPPAEQDEDMSMDVTSAVGGILRRASTQSISSQISDGTMELTQAVGKITGQKRRRSATGTEAAESASPNKQSKRRRSSAARSSFGDDTMDLTTVVGGIQSTGSPVKQGRRRSMRNRRSSGQLSDVGDATMEFTRAIGGIQSMKTKPDESLVGDEELSMELTVVLGGIKDKSQQQSRPDSPPATPDRGTSPAREALNTTPKDQERFKESEDLSARKSLTLSLQEAAERSHDKQSPSQVKLRRSVSPLKASVAASPREASEHVKAGQKDGLRGSSPVKDNIFYPDLPPLEQKPSVVTTPKLSPSRAEAVKTPVSGQRGGQSIAAAAMDLSPTTAKQQRSSPARPSAATPQKPATRDDSRDLSASMKLLTTPRKEPLKAVTPKKQTPANVASPVKTVGAKERAVPTSGEADKVIPSPIRRLQQDLLHVRGSDHASDSIGLQDFLVKAGIRFMDLTTTKRRLTAAPTPSKARDSSQNSEIVTLESGVIAAACTVPEMELYQHACHELKRYTKAGKQVIASLEAATLEEQPPLLQAYVRASPDRKLALDAAMRDMKTDARLRSKEIWYSWRSQLLDELLVGLQKTGEGMIKDDEILGQSEDIIEQVLPSLIEKRSTLQEETERLRMTVHSVSEDEKEEVDVTRAQLRDVNEEIKEKRAKLDMLRQQVEEQDTRSEHLRESKEEFTAVIQEANRIRDASRGVSLDELTLLKESVNHLESTYGWSITSASSSPSTMTMTYKSELQLLFNPRAFQQGTSPETRANDAIRLSYVAENQKRLSTTLRFFLQLLRATLLGLPQCTTKVSDLLLLVSSGWDTACIVAEAERRLNLEGLSETRIVSDDQLSISSIVLLTKVKTKVRATFELTAAVNEDLQMTCSVIPHVTVVYGEEYNEKNMSEFLRGVIGDGYEGWDVAIAQMREKLVARGPKGSRK